ncbi:MAG: hypothetical protein M3Z23_10085 [Acidobacteriota bacterium]|nr:hypothetical protein [Acidobacteriota bacterium]
MRSYAIIAAIVLFSAAAQAETALLECTANARTAEYFLVQFRVSAIQGWTVEKALLLLHVKDKALRERVEVAPINRPWKESSAELPQLGKSVEAQEQPRPDGWISISLSPGMVQPLVLRTIYGFAIKIPSRYDSRQTVQYSPYLVVQGKPGR